MAISSSGVITIILIILFILIVLLLVIIFIVVYCGKKGLNNKCKKSRDCKSGLICYHGECKAGLGEDCNDDKECASRMVCVKSICKKKKRRQLNVNKDRKIEINTIDSSASIKQIKSQRKLGGAGVIVGVNAEDERKKITEEKWNPGQKIYQKQILEKNHELFIIDTCNYSRYTIYLMSDNSFVISEGSDSRTITSELDVSSIINYNGYLHCIGNGRLYYLDNNTIDHDKWEWFRVSWAPHGIIDMSVPHDKTFIWLRTKFYGGLYDHDGHIIQKIDNPYRRIYGVDKDNYISFDYNGDAVVQPGNLPFLDVKDAVIDHKGELFILEGKDSKYRLIRLVDWKAFYIP